MTTKYLRRESSEETCILLKFSRSFRLPNPSSTMSLLRYSDRASKGSVTSLEIPRGWYALLPIENKCSPIISKRHSCCVEAYTRDLHNAYL